MKKENNKINKKSIMIILIAFTLLTSVLANTIIENIQNKPDKNIFTKDEFKKLSDNEIKDIMQNDNPLTRIDYLENKIMVYYNVTYLEPTHVNNNYRKFTQEFGVKITYDEWDLCMEKIGKEEDCINYLVYDLTPHSVIENNSYIKEVTEYKNISITKQIEEIDKDENIIYKNITTYESEPYKINKTFYEITETIFTPTKNKTANLQNKQYERAYKFKQFLNKEAISIEK